MSVVRVNKTKDFTVMSNYHLRDNRLTLKAKGLLSLMLSLPENWNYSIGGLVAICVESESAVKAALNELKRNGYVVVTKLPPSKTESGRYEYTYDVYEQSRCDIQGIEKQGVENQPLENQQLENRTLYKRTYESSTDNKSTNKENMDDKKKSPPKLIFGEEFQLVRLAEEEHNKLIERLGESATKDYIDRLDCYLAQGHSYKSHYATILTWRRKDDNQQSKPKEEPVKSQFEKDMEAGVNPFKRFER